MLDFSQHPQKVQTTQETAVLVLWVDRDVGHPTEFDFYLQSHGGLLGTRCGSLSNLTYGLINMDLDFIQPSCTLQWCVSQNFSVLLVYRHVFDPVLLDENNLSPDGLQELSFALCHVYARSTRSVSIPAPVYCKYQVFSLYLC